MKKDLEWLKEEVYEMMPSHSELYDHPDYTTVETVKMLDRFIGLIDQVEQPALPVIPDYVAEWIDENTYHNHYVGKGFVFADDLQNLLVPKQELPVIPDYVANHIETAKNRGDTLAQGYNISTYYKEGEWLLEKENCELFARAWLDGYTVEEEQKYYVLLPKIKRNWLYVSLRSNYDEFIDHYTDSVEDLQAFTEKEIKAIEPRYFAFAVPVEEMEG